VSTGRGRPAADGALAAGANLQRSGLRLLFWILAGTLTFNSLFGDMGLVQGFRQRRAAARLRREVEDLRRENARLVTDIKELRQDPYRIEAIAREELGLSRPGEIIFLFQGSEAASPEPPEAAPEGSPTLP